MVVCESRGLRERVTLYSADFDSKKSDIGLKNTYKWIPFP
jgi:hypothetical protein